MPRCLIAYASASIALSLLTAPASAAPSVASSRQLCRLTDSRIDEASGIAPGIRSRGVFYVQNDSGDSARFFAIDARTCATAATVTVDGAQNVDWEDIAVAPDVRGRPSVWLADIGDNGAKRPEVDVYRVDEPTVAAGAHDVTIRTDGADVWRLRYPGGAMNAESLAVTPNGVAYVITKSLTGVSEVYRVPADPSATSVQTLQRVGTIDFAPTGTDDSFGVAGELTATSAAISPDGRLLAVRTYSDTYLWRVRNGDVAAALRAPAIRLALPKQPQGEGIGFYRSRLVLDSEGVGSAVYTVAVPPVPSAPTSAQSSRSATMAKLPTAPSAAPSPSAADGASGWLTGLVILGVLAVLAGTFSVVQLIGNRRVR